MSKIQSFFQQKIVWLPLLILTVLVATIGSYFLFAPEIQTPTESEVSTESVSDENQETPEVQVNTQDQYYQDILASLSADQAIVQPKTLPGEVSTFYAAYNLGGSEMLIDGNLWKQADIETVDFEFEGEVLINEDPSLNFNPIFTDPNREKMMRDFIWHSGRPIAQINMKNIENGKYWVFIYVFEETSPTNMNIYLNRKIVAKNLSSGQPGTWTKFGPLAVSVTERQIEMISTGGDVNFSGIELYQLQSV